VAKTKTIDEDTIRRMVELFVTEGLALEAAAALADLPAPEAKHLAGELAAPRFETGISEDGRVWLEVAQRRLVDMHIRDLRPGLLYDLD
jgi:hypothetical protein